MNNIIHFKRQLDEITNRGDKVQFLTSMFLHYVLRHKFYMCDYIMRIRHKYGFKWYESIHNNGIFTIVYWLKKDTTALKYLLSIDNNYPTDHIYNMMFGSLFKSDMIAYYIWLESALYKKKYKLCCTENIGRKPNHHK